MNPDVVAFRISRRAIAVVALADETFTFSDVRYLPSNQERAADAALRYALSLVDRFRPPAVALYAPTNIDGVTRRIANLLVAGLHERSISVHVIEKGALFTAFSTTALTQHRQVQDAVLDIWPQYGERKSKAAPLIADAAAAALFADTHPLLPLQP